MVSEWLIKELRIAKQLSEDYGKFPEPNRSKKLKKYCISCKKNNINDCNPLEDSCNKCEKIKDRDNDC